VAERSTTLATRHNLLRKNSPHLATRQFSNAAIEAAAIE
jgi:hypothetical protein